nr:MAG TPA: hypothetical protein [Bacteriophage sp.]
MDLPSELISEFAKITNDSNVKKEEDSILYGTVVEFEGSLCVKLDGSNEITPAITTSTIKAGDRVSVSLKKHTAIITGNLSDPSASGADLSKVKMEITEHGVVFSGLADGTTVINGACIKTGTIDAERINLKGKFVYQYSSDKNNWHDVMEPGDKYRRESIDSGKTWGEPYQFVGKDGANGSDASVPSYVQVRGIDFTSISNNYIKSPKIYGGEFYGTEFNVIADGSDGSFNLYGDFDGRQLHLFKIGYFAGDAPFVEIESPVSAPLNIGSVERGTVYMKGYVDFQYATVKNLNLHLTFS